MKIGVLTTCYNEELMLPYFLTHYLQNGWDEIRVLLDRETTDRSFKICKQFPKVNVQPCGMTAGLHELEKVAILQGAYNEMCREGFDWIAILDSDELIVPPGHRTLGMSPKAGLELIKDDCVMSAMFPVFRNVEDTDLDLSKSPLPQRLHGMEPRSNEIKPNVLRGIEGTKLTIGMHQLGQDLKVSPHFFIGAHWADCDLSISVARRLSRQARFSKDNWTNGWGVQHMGISEYSIRQEAAEHLFDPIIPALEQVVCK